MTRHRRRRVSVGAIVLAAALTPGVASAQPDSQFWGELSLSWIQSEHLTFGVDVEPKVLVPAPPGESGWATLDVTPSVEYSHGRWVDAIGDLKTGRTRQTDDLISTEITPRIGVRLHLLSNLRDAIVKDRRPQHRLVLRNLLRLEWRNLFYSDGRPDESTSRLRDRVELLLALTRPRITDDGAVWLLSDVEWFWPRGDPEERFANKQRIRAGVGYRRSASWRFEALYVWDRARDSASGDLAAVDHAVKLRVRRVW